MAIPTPTIKSPIKPATFMGSLRKVVGIALASSVLTHLRIRAAIGGSGDLCGCGRGRGLRECSGNRDSRARWLAEGSSRLVLFFAEARSCTRDCNGPRRRRGGGGRAAYRSAILQRTGREA